VTFTSGFLVVSFPEAVGAFDCAAFADWLSLFCDLSEVVTDFLTDGLLFF
jgi:hypothetical protein